MIVSLTANPTLKTHFPLATLYLLNKIYSVFQSAEVQKLWVLGKREEK
ncbi:hypothetical protein C789_1983 [Microcystis aeruginosa FACHB-905 = DIANCHI905]|uniref:Uncharacterized protein n=1 Tax=Microcystis aeruginosa PCC 7806SL TaxID=1903187 RepID=A0AB33BXB2_MICA7|nr:hypothetical protein BH695_1022 [Microcystis aeruginosa PCC 7806SL]ELS48210.1 hypothetical protein C789_1983 [Microcystis aeruginosa FACHB-905 = DIANCHI905]